MPTQPLRIGHGYDLHRLEPCPPEGSGRPFVLGGIDIDHDRGPISHSDGDVLLHAVTDALLGAIGAPDIGQLFPDTAKEHEDACSEPFLREAVRRVRDAGYRMMNMDVTIICERPKLSPYKDLIAKNLTRILECDERQVNLKAKTHEKVDSIGEGRAVEVHVVTLLALHDQT